MAKDKDKKPENKKEEPKKTGHKQDTKKDEKSSKKPEKKAPAKKPDTKSDKKAPDKKAPSKADKKAPAKKSEPKKVVKPGEKKDVPGQLFNMQDLKQKGQTLIMNHPELVNNARGLFRNENGRTIVQERVPRGDIGLSKPLSHSDLKDDDLRGLAVFATTLIDPDLARYDSKTAQEDALTKAIDKKDDGKYAGIINANSYALILENMGQIKKAAERVERPTQEDKDKPSGLDRGKDKVKRQIEKVKERKEKAPEKEAPKKEESKEKSKSKEAGMDKEMLLNEREALMEKMAALDTLIVDGEGIEKEAASAWIEATKKARAELKKGGNEKPGFKEVADLAKKKYFKKEEKEASEETTEEAPQNEIIAALDELAGDLEKQDDFELFKIAYQLDTVADVLEGKKEASCLEGDLDEAFMKAHFKAGSKEKDADESFMKEFDNDNTLEVAGVVGKKASELPYQKKD